MKRFFVLLLTLILCVSLLAVPALAAEPQEYIFEFAPSVSFYVDYVFSGEGQFAVYEGRVPEGTYNVFLMKNDEWIPFGLSSLTVDYSFMVEDFAYSVSSFPVSEFYTVDVGISDTYASYGYSGMIVSYKETEKLDGMFIKLVPVDDGFDLPYDTISDLLQSLFQLITENPLLSALCAGSLILVCIPLFVDLKKSSR